MAGPVRPTVQTKFGICTVTDERGQTARFPEYQHYPLPPGRMIRLLKLEPRTRSWPLSSLSEANEFSLVEHRLESSDTQKIDVSKSPYVAVSYSWGEPVFDAPLMIVANGRRTVLPITNTAWEAIHRTLPAIAQDNKLMWIDQICINQKDELEKGRQVMLIGEIYRRCWHCMIWLGPAGSNTQAAFATLNKLQVTLPHNRSIPIDQRHVADLPHAQIRTELASRVGRDVLPPASDPGWTEIARLLSERSWFRRLWTFQEATLCYTGGASICCGPYHIPFITFIRAALFMGSEKTFWGLDFSHGRATLMEISTFRFHVEHHQLTPLIWLLQNNSMRNCQNPRDRIYALLGLRREDGPEYPIQADYRTSPKALYTDVARKIIKSQVSLRICSESAEKVAEYAENEAPGLPSWVPDWTRESLVRTFELFNASQSFFRASGRRKHNDIIERMDVLTCRGKIIDSIVAVSEIEIPDRLTLPEKQQYCQG